MNRRKFLGLSIAGSALGLSGLSAIASTPAVANVASGTLYSKENPGRWAKKIDGHMPNIKVTKAKDAIEVTVTTAHAMNGYEHYIVKHIIYDEKFNVLAEKMFDPKKDKTPVSSHKLKNVKGKIYVTSVCNKHDTWIANTIV